MTACTGITSSGLGGRPVGPCPGLYECTLAARYVVGGAPACGRHLPQVIRRELDHRTVVDVREITDDLITEQGGN